MKQLRPGVWALAIVFLFAACSGTGGRANNTNNLNGNWTASLTDPNGTPAFSFTTSLTQSGNGTLDVTNLNFTTSSPCFANGESATGGFTLSGTTSGVTNGGFQMIITSTPSAPLAGSNVLTLNGTVTNGNTISGTWTLTGLQSGCTGSGNFTMSRL